jgi:hypothetical protein
VFGTAKHLTCIRPPKGVLCAIECRWMNVCVFYRRGDDLIGMVHGEATAKLTMAAIILCTVCYCIQMVLRCYAPPPAPMA